MHRVPMYYECDNIDRIYEIFLNIVEKEKETQNLQDIHFCPKCVIPMQFYMIPLVEDTDIPTDDYVKALKCPKCHHIEIL
jgi:hypothetical protein